MLRLYHGSNVEVQTPQLIRSNRTLDFGPGFYTTTNRDQAVDFSRRVTANRKTVPSVVGLVAKRKNLSEIEASKLFYRSKVYALLSDESTKVWHYGAETVFSMLEDELAGREIEFPEEAF